MNKIFKFLLPFFLTLTLINPSLSEWKKVITDKKDGSILYVDFKTLRKLDGSVYFWGLRNLIKPDVFGDMSYTMYTQVDCKLSRLKVLRERYFRDLWGKGKRTIPKIGNPKWIYPKLSRNQILIKTVCNK